MRRRVLVSLLKTKMKYSLRTGIYVVTRENRNKVFSKRLPVVVFVIVVSIIVVVFPRGEKKIGERKIGGKTIVAKKTFERHGISEDVKPFDENTKTILLWNDYFGSKHFGLSLGRVTFAGCKVNNCELWDRLDDETDFPYEKYDLIVFHGIDTGSSTIEDLPTVRRPEQRYMFILQESPAMRPHFYNLRNFFNWTATYRRDSDFPLCFVALDGRETPLEIKGHQVVWKEPTFSNPDVVVPESFSNKSKQVAWFVSSGGAKSLRDDYVQELAKHIKVDIYGAGREFTCAHADKSCETMLDTTYKFYLAFENSLCGDYVTEKFFRGLSHYIVPIVYGGADYKQYAPPMSYIDVKNFVSPKELARYLHYLDKHPDEYRKYFWWKEFYQQGQSNFWCNVCEKLHDPNEPNKVYPNMDAWWNYPGVCVTPEEHFFRGGK